MGEDITFNLIMRRTLALIGDDLVAALGIVGAITAIVTLADVAAPNGASFVGIPVLVAQYYVIRRLLDRHGLRSAERFGGFGSFFVLGIVTTIPIIFGTLLFIVPGLYLAGRWAMSDAVLLAENQGFSSAMQRSWSLTGDHGWPVALAFLVLAAPAAVMSAVVLAGAFLAGAAGLDPTANLPLDAVYNLSLYASQVALWYFGVALYAIFVGTPGSTLDEVFA